MATKEKTDKKKKDPEEKPVIARSAADLQRLKLEKLMKNPDKPVVIPERPKGKNTPHVPEFVRNVMGSSAGAGSGEFHVYRHLRRKEYARQKFIQEKAEKETLEEEYHRKLEENRRKAEEVTAKKRAKRLKKKKQKNKNVKKPRIEKKSSSSEEESDSEKEEVDSDASKGVSDTNTITTEEKKDEEAVAESTSIDSSVTKAATNPDISPSEGSVRADEDEKSQPDPSQKEAQLD